MRKNVYRKGGKLISLFMAVVLILGMLPMQVLAAEGHEEGEVKFIVTFDPDNGKTQYKDFYKVMVPGGGKVTSQPEDPRRDGYLFEGWYAYLDRDGDPVLWDFDKDVIEDSNMTLWAAWRKGYIVAFDPDDDKTQYQDFYKVTVPKGAAQKVTDKPEDPKRDGYIFKGWYAYLDENYNPVLWDFEKDTIRENNTTLWAAWEAGCLVVYDPDDDVAQYQDFYKVTVPIGEKVTDKPEDPKRDGYIFKGWYAYLDENYNPVLWDFESETVADHNMTLWAAWEKGCLVAYDPDDDVAQYQDFYKVMVPVGEKITDKPEDPKRDGYIFKGWYAYLDENYNPVLWDFESETVADHNMTLWAAWGKETGNPGGENPGGENPGGENPGGENPGGENPGGENPGGENPGGENPGGENPGGENPGGENPGNGDGEEEQVDIEDGKIPEGSGELDNVPKTGDNSVPQILYIVLALVSLVVLRTSLKARKKAV